MKKINKLFHRILPLAAVTLFMLCGVFCTCVYPYIASADEIDGVDVYERETGSADNNIKELAESIPLGKVLGGEIRWSDTDFYYFNISSYGYITFSFGNYGNTRTGLQYTVYCDNDKVENNRIFTYNEKITDYPTQTVRMGVYPGKYYVMVSRFYSDLNTYKYKLKVDFTAEKGWESGVNNYDGDACPIKIDSRVNGSFTRSTDMDYYALTVDKPLAVKLVCEFLQTDRRLENAKLYLLKAGKNGITTLRSFQLTEGSFESEAFNLEAGDYIVEMSCGLIDLLGVEYTLTVKTDHVHEGKWTTVEPATCTEEGSETCVCDACGYTATRPIKKIKHDYGKAEVLQKPTLTENGLERYTCKVCGHILTKTADSLWWVLPLAIGGGFIIIGEIVYVVLLVKFII